MRWQLWAFCSLILFGNTATAAESVLASPPKSASASIYGQWRLVGASVDVPVKCRHSVLHITQDGYFAEQSHSPAGEFFSFRAKARIQQEGSRYLLTLSPPQHNGKPDCLGNSASDISNNFQARMHLQVSGDRLFHYIGSNSELGYLRYVRQP